MLPDYNISEQREYKLLLLSKHEYLYGLRMELIKYCLNHIKNKWHILET
jgi:hypothetical protein